MFEIKITGSTAEEIRKDLLEVATVFGVTEAKADGWESGSKVKNGTEKEVAVNEQSEPAKNAKPDESAKEEAGAVGQAEAATTGESDTTTEETPANEEPKYTLEEVRAKAASLNRAGKKDLVKDVITKTGASKLTEVNASNYNWMMECFEAGCVIEEVK